MSRVIHLNLPPAPAFGHGIGRPSPRRAPPSGAARTAWAASREPRRATARAGV